MTEVILFWVFAVLVVGTAIFVVSAKNPIHSAVALVFCFFCLAGIFVLQNAHFLAVIEIMVYAGAIMVLFVFVIMLLNLSNEELGKSKRTITKGVGIFAACVVAVVAVWATAPRADEAGGPAPGPERQALRITTAKLNSVTAGDEFVVQLAATGGDAPYRWEIAPPVAGLAISGAGEVKGRAPRLGPRDRRDTPSLTFNVTVADAKGARAVRPFTVPVVDERFGTTAKVGRLLFDKYVLPFEIVSLLLLVAMVGAVVMAKKRI